MIISKIGDPPEDCPDPSIWPTADSSHRITNGTAAPGTNGHATYLDSGQAVDIGVGVGTQVFTTHSGEVIKTGFGSGGYEGYGNFVEIQSSCNGTSFSSLYAHLSVINVTVGTQVTAGQVIGLSGSTGNSTGPHLHYELIGLPIAGHFNY